MINQNNGKRIVAVSAMVTFSMGFLKATGKGDLPSARFLVGIGVAFTIVAVMTDLGSPIGPAFAILIMLVAFLTQFQDVYKVLNKSSGYALSPKKKGKGRNGRPGRGRPTAPVVPVIPPDYPEGIYRPSTDAVVTIN